MCHLSVPPFARCMHLSCVDSSMYMLTFTFGLRCFIFHGFSWVLNGLERVRANLSVLPFARCMRLSCVESSMYVLTFTFGFRCFIFHFFFGSWSLPVCFLQFCMVLPSFLHSFPRLNGLESGEGCVPS